MCFEVRAVRSLSGITPYEDYLTVSEDPPFISPFGKVYHRLKGHSIGWGPLLVVLADFLQDWSANLLK